MLTKGPAKKVTIFINEDVPHRMTSLHDAIMTFLLHKGVAGATATRAFSGFGSHHALHTPQDGGDGRASSHPDRVYRDAERVDELLPTLYEMVTDGLIEVQDTTVVKLARIRAGREPKLHAPAASHAGENVANLTWAKPTNGTASPCTTPS